MARGEFDRMYNPSSIAIVGASRDPNKGGGYLLKGLLGSGYKGGLYAVNPNESEVFGQKCYRTVTDIPDEIDLAIIAVPARLVPQVMADCGRKGVKFAIVHSAGFSELGPEGKELEKEMLKYARQSGTRVVGPNCMGLYSPGARINTILSFLAFANEPGGVAFIGQSGWVTENAIQLGNERGVRFSKVLSIGNQSDVTIEELLDYFSDDQETHVISFYAEGIRRGRDFLDVARRVSKKKPILAWKGGCTAGGARAASSHTGSLAGSGVIVDAAMAQSGVIAARGLEELVDLMVGFSSPFMAKGNRVGLLVEAGGGAVAGCDAAESLGLNIPLLSEQAQHDLVALMKNVLPPFATPRNPVDIVWAPTKDPANIFLQCSRVMLREVDALVILSYLEYDDAFVRDFSALRDEAEKPVMVVPGHVVERRPGMNTATKNGLPAFNTTERVMRVLSAMSQYAGYRQAG